MTKRPIPFGRFLLAPVFVSFVLFPSLAQADTDQLWSRDGSTGSWIWHVDPSPGRCNESLAKNIARRAGLLFPRLVISDPLELVFEGTNIAGDREIIVFWNVRGCPDSTP